MAIELSSDFPGANLICERIDGDDVTPVRTVPGLSRTEGALANSNGRLYAMASGTGQLVMRLLKR